MASEEFIHRLDKEYGKEIKRYMRGIVGSDFDYVYNGFLIRIWREVNEKEIRDIKAFIYTVAYNECISHLRKERRYYNARTLDTFK